MFFREERLLDRFKSLKHYFFLDLGDFFIHFYDNSEAYLEQLTKNVSVEKMKSLLELAIRTSRANTDPFNDDLTCELNSYTLIEQIFAMQNIRGALGSNAYILNSDWKAQQRDPNQAISINQV